jgi:acetyl esterase/lipase
MRDENIEYAMRLMQVGVSTKLHIYPGAFHGFDGFFEREKRAEQTTYLYNMDQGNKPN